MVLQAAPAEEAAAADGEDDFDELLQRPLSAVQQALKAQQKQQHALAPATATTPAHATDAAAVATASHSHLHLPTFEQVDIGACVRP